MAASSASESGSRYERRPTMSTRGFSPRLAQARLNERTHARRVLRGRRVHRLVDTMRRPAEALGERAVGEDALERVGEALHVLGIDEQPRLAVADELGDPTGAPADRATP